MLHTGVDETLFVQILQAYGARNPSELILDAAYDACLKALTSDSDNTTELQQRFGAKLFLTTRQDGQSILVAGTKKRNLELIPFRRVHATLQQLTQTYHENATQLKQAVKAKVLGIPEEIVQEYCDMAVSALPPNEAHTGREEDFKKSFIISLLIDHHCIRCTSCGFMKSHKSFAKHKDKPLGLRSRCRACESKGRLDKKQEDEQADGILRRKKKKESYLGLTGTAICAACGERKPVYEFDKARQKPFTLKCRTCSEMNAPLKSKLCCSCALELPLDRFYRDSYTKAGFRPRCMDCMKGRRGAQTESSLFTDPGLDEGFEAASVKKPRRRRRRKTKRKFESKETSIRSLDVDHPSRIVSRRLMNGSEEAVVKLEALDPMMEGASMDTGRHRKGLTGCTTVRDEQGNMTKYCTGCLDFKDASEFGRDVSKPSGLRSRCRQCHRRPSKSTVAEADVTSTKIPRKPMKKQSPIFDKICVRCNHEKPIGDFYRDKSKDDSYASICKKCARQAKTKERRSEGASNGFQKLSRGHVNEMDETEMRVVMNYIDALLPESSECSGDVDVERPIEDTNTVLHRSCVGCHVEKSWIEFDPNPMAPDGLCPLCKECRRGYGMKGRRLSGQKLKRCCLRCGKAKTSDAFIKSIFYPNRTSRICYSCRDEDTPSSSKRKRRRLEDVHKHLVDLIDFDCDLLRVRDPDAGYDVWKTCESESASEGPAVIRDRGFKAPNTELRSSSPNTLTITHRVPAQCPKQLEMPLAVQNGCPLLSMKLPHITEKQCRRCGEMKSRDRFYVDDQEASHLGGMCIDCADACWE